MRSTTLITCVNCGGTKDIPTAEYNRQIRLNPKRNWFCSSHCRGEYKTKINTVNCICPICGKEFTKTLAENKIYCSKSCANVARFSTEEARLKHRLAIKRSYAENAQLSYCEHCGRVLSSGNRRFCSIDCTTKHHWERVFKQIESSGQYPTTTHGETDRRVVRKYITTHVGTCCAICGKTNVKLTVDHIDGNAMNSSFENLRMLCDECDRNTLTYKNKPHEANRQWRRKINIV
jgi:hypothetical protein